MKDKEMVYLMAVIALLLTSVAAADPPAPAAKYKNYTVGDNDGWLFNTTTNTASANYATWAASKTFNLGDTLIFNTNSNQTVVQTYNKTSYKSCTVDEYTFQYYAGSQNYSEPATIPVPLIIVGPNYFFSSAFDGVQCRRGLAFGITVKQGLGLPPSLNQPPPPAYVEPPPPTADDQSPPVAVTSPDKDDTNEPGGGAKVHWVVNGLMVFVGVLLAT